MSADSVDAIGGVFNGTLGELGEEFEWAFTRLDLMVSLLAISAVENNGALVEEAADLFDDVLSELRGRVPAESSEVIGYPLVDAVELVECFGGEALYELLSSALQVLLQGSHEIPGELVRVYSDCLGWERDPEELPPSIVAGGIVASFTGALNKALARRIAG